MATFPVEQAFTLSINCTSAKETIAVSQLAITEEQTDQIFLYIVGSDSAVASAEDLQAVFLDAGIEDYVEVYRGAFDRMTDGG